ncbi:NUDIX hydrolase [Ruminococcus sp.]|uniref:NUDIX domain-containing protein n=1 Tax=Ruminococcus sp. TaxID=41978 RepID=UPI0025CBC988|nr:NUDIX hydrolase [Ruminococcus sp.]MBQ6252247.1 NUDIX hydrolase [Ruminococcus sp.]MBR3666994.1 NUDIX hydrolase [Ruminococcus sp.]MBR6994728.1 NUDIX hydrolase [Ruminococcus sp.]
MHLQEKTLTSDVKYEGVIFTITHDTAELENGKTAPRDVLHHNGGVCVIPVTENNEIFLVKQFRYPFQTVTREVPAGKLEKGEDHAECGRRELLEETGCTCSEYIYLGEMLPTPAYNSEITYMYLAKGLTFTAQSLDPDEFLDVERIPLSEAVAQVMDGTIRDGKTQIAILKAARMLGI